MLVFWSRAESLRCLCRESSEGLRMRLRGRKRFVGVTEVIVPVDAKLLGGATGDDPVQLPFGTSRDGIGPKRRKGVEGHDDAPLPKSDRSSALDQIADDEPITLRQASILLGGAVSEKGLRAAARRGDLVVEKLGRGWKTSLRAIREWREKCRLSAKEPDSIRNSPRTGIGFSSSKTLPPELQRDAVLTMFAARKRSSRNTSRPKE